MLRDLELCFTYGFMLFDPSSTFDSVRENIAYLRQITAHGITPVTFCRTLPYAATPMEAQLATEGRLRGSAHNPDYYFLDPRLDSCVEALSQFVHPWMSGSDALATQFNFAWHEYWVLRRLFPPVPGLREYGQNLRSMTHRSNRYILDLVAEVCRWFDEGMGRTRVPAEVQSQSTAFIQEMVNARDAFVSRHQQTLLATLDAAAVEGCGTRHYSAVAV
jgi:hypothetical protein